MASGSNFAPPGHAGINPNRFGAGGMGMFPPGAIMAGRHAGNMAPAPLAMGRPGLGTVGGRGMVQMGAGNIGNGGGLARPMAMNGGAAVGAAPGGMDLLNGGQYAASGDILALLSKGGVMAGNLGMTAVNMGQLTNGLQGLSMHVGGLGPSHGMGGVDGDHGEAAPYDLNEFPALGAPAATGARGGYGQAGSGALRGGPVDASPELMSRGFNLSSMLGDGMPSTSIGQPAVSYSGVAGIGSTGANQMQQQEFVIQDQDFPALPGAKREKSSTLSASSPQPAGSEGAVGGGQAQTGGNGQPSHPSSGGSTAADRFGMVGLLSVIRMTDRNLNTLALGTDLMTLGLNLNAGDALYENFYSPWSETQHPKEDYQLPPCYLIGQLQLKDHHLQKFTDATLFYIFYHLHRDSHYPRKQLLQIAAQELFNRGWRYSQENNLWVTRTPTNEMKFFDYQTWEHRPFVPDAARAASHDDSK